MLNNCSKESKHGLLWNDRFSCKFHSLSFVSCCAHVLRLVGGSFVLCCFGYNFKLKEALFAPWKIFQMIHSLTLKMKKWMRRQEATPSSSKLLLLHFHMQFLNSKLCFWVWHRSHHFHNRILTWHSMIDSKICLL